MGAVVETPSIYLGMTAAENLRQQYRVLGLPSERGISDLLRLVGLEGAGSKRARAFSLGMRQRLGIAMALAGRRPLLLDQPTNGLDPQGMIEMRELILKLNREQGITFLISSHILDELARLAAHYGFLDAGDGPGDRAPKRWRPSAASASASKSATSAPWRGSGPCGAASARLPKTSRKKCRRRRTPSSAFPPATGPYGPWQARSMPSCRPSGVSGHFP